jgi:AcrR family transcriptional regulator
MPKTTKQYLELKEERKNQIINGALKLFCERGFDAVNVDEICKYVKISHGLFYHYFTSKLDLQRAIINNGQERNKKTREFLDNSTLTGLEYIKKSTSLILENLKSDEMACYYYYYMIIENPPRKDDKDKRRPKVFKRLIQEIENGQKNKDIVPGDPHEILFANFTMLIGIALLNMKHKKTVQPMVPDLEIVMNLFYRKKDE